MGTTTNSRRGGRFINSDGKLGVGVLSSCPISQKIPPLWFHCNLCCYKYQESASIQGDFVRCVQPLWATNWWRIIHNWNLYLCRFVYQFDTLSVSNIKTYTTSAPYPLSNLYFSEVTIYVQHRTTSLPVFWFPFYWGPSFWSQIQRRELKTLDQLTTADWKMDHEGG